MRIPVSAFAVCLIVLLKLRGAAATTFKASGCFGTGNCNTLEFTECLANERIRMTRLAYGVKGTATCKAGRRQCRKSIGCCAHGPDDCLNPFGQLHALSMYGLCSGKASCHSVPVVRARMNGCAAEFTDEFSTFAFVEYECVADFETIGICEDVEVSAGVIHVVLGNDHKPAVVKATDCSCNVKVDDGSAIVVEAVDIRLVIGQDISDGTSTCSSSRLSTSSDSSSWQCDSTKKDTENFWYNQKLTSFTGGSGSVTVENIYQNGGNDLPLALWLAVSAEAGKQVTVSCGSRVSTTQDTTTTTGGVTSDNTMTSTTSATNSTNNIGGQTDDDGNTGAIVAGVLVPVLLLVVGAIVVFFLWRRRRRSKDPSGPIEYSGEPRYTDTPSLERNSVANSQYDEIGMVPDVCTDESHYDAVANGKPPNNKRTNMLEGHQNGHYYENLSKKDEKSLKPSSNKPNASPQQQKSAARKSAKTPYGEFKAKRDRVLAFFGRKTTEREPGPKKDIDSDSEVSARSGDGLQAKVKVKVTPSDNNTNTPSGTKDVEAKKTSEVKKAPPSPKGVKAVHVGDQYIEFQFGALDENPQDLFQGSNTASQSRPLSSPKRLKPNRPPPKPSVLCKPASSTPNLSAITPTGHLTPAEKSASLKPTPTNYVYDYAEAEPDIATEKSDKGDNFYDYADEEDGPSQGNESYVTYSVYEEVDSSKRHTSAEDIPKAVLGYEVPVTGSTGIATLPVRGSSGSSGRTEASRPIVNQTEVPVTTETKSKVVRDLGKSSATAGKGGNLEKTLKSELKQAGSKDTHVEATASGVKKMAAIFEKAK